MSTTLPSELNWATTRREFLQHGSVWLLGAGVAISGAPHLMAADSPRRVRLGMVTDLHYADKPSFGSRHYRETLTKFAEAGERFRKSRPDFIVELGDLIDSAATVEEEKKYLTRIIREFEELPGKKHYVLGNHCVQTLTKEEFLEGVGQQKSSYSFDVGGIHFVILDACFRSDHRPYGRNNAEWNDANVPPAQREWLRADLQSAGKTIVFVHQRLDVKNDYAVKNAAQVREILEASGKVLAVFQGHSHQNDLQQIGGIPYCTLAAMIEGTGESNNGYSILDVFENGSIHLTGYRRQRSHVLAGRGT